MKARDERKEKRECDSGPAGPGETAQAAAEKAVAPPEGGDGGGCSGPDGAQAGATEGQEGLEPAAAQGGDEERLSVEPGDFSEAMERLTSAAEAARAETLAGLRRVEERLGKLEEAVSSASEQISFVPPQVRMLAGKVDGLATVICESKYRSLLCDMVGIFDLVDQVLRDGGLNFVSTADYLRGYSALQAQLRQILELNGLSEIPAEGAFNSELHRAVRRVESSVPDLHWCIKEVLRPGFQSGKSILRFADVEVYYYVPPKDNHCQPASSGGEGPDEDGDKGA